MRRKPSPARKRLKHIKEIASGRVQADAEHGDDADVESGEDAASMAGPGYKRPASGLRKKPAACRVAFATPEKYLKPNDALKHSRKCFVNKAYTYVLRETGSRDCAKQAFRDAAAVWDTTCP